MSADEEVQAALRLLTEAGRLDILKEGVVGPSRPLWRASSGVAVAVLACSPPRTSDGRQAVSGGGAEGGAKEVLGAWPQENAGGPRRPVEPAPLPR
ncbi:hypothetical protein NDU88_000945 [Pleurodeles waltl]|uniref:Uncharacterized protein n=1 Tax=Pleurodeles waltl TaxID=8319 RepID=A0AAV7SXY7_PLEWA|nr:hypothetical protein NDU88_000945 [Pleurodeles waltl]